MIDVKNLKSLIKLMVENDLTELDVQDPQGERVTLKRGRAEAHGAHAAGLPLAHAGGPGTSGAGGPGSAGVAPPPAPLSGVGDGATTLAQITSPIVGTFYAAATPEAKAFINVGDRVQPDTIVCIIEAMKVFNEIKAETAGIIEKVLVTSGQAVEFGQPLFTVRPG